MSKIKVPNILEYFIPNDQFDSTLYSEKIHVLFFTLVQEYFRKDVTNVTNRLKPRLFNSIPNNYISLASAIKRTYQIDIHENFLSTLCFPGKNRKNKKWTKGIDKEKLVTIYQFLINHPFLASKKEEDWIHEIRTTSIVLPVDDNELITYILENTNFSRIGSTYRRSHNANRFYDGFPVRYEDLAADFDFPRAIYFNKNGIADVLKRHEEQTESSFIIISSPGGTGKSILINRIGFNLAGKGKQVFTLNSDWIEDHRSHNLQTQIKLFIKHVDDCIIIIDGVAECIFREEINLKSITESFLDKKVLWLFCEQSNRWNQVKNKIRAITSNRNFFYFQLTTLTDIECNTIVDKMIDLEEHGDLTVKNASLSRHERLEICQNSSGRHLLIAMLQTRYGKNFYDIILEEYENIPSKIGKEAYLNICFWHKWYIKIPESLFMSSMSFETALDLSDYKTTTEDLIINDNIGLASRHVIIADILYRTFIIDKFQCYYYVKKIFTVIGDDVVGARRFLNRFSDEEFPQLFITILKRDKDLINEIILIINSHATFFDKELFLNFLTFKAMVARIIGNDDEAISIYKHILNEIDSEYSFALRQIAWIEHDRKNFDIAAKYAIDSFHCSRGVADHIIQIARILSQNTIENFKKADFYYKEAISASSSNKKYKEEYTNYLNALNSFSYLKSLSEKQLLPEKIVRLLKPNLKFLKTYFGINSDLYKEELLNTLHSIGGNSEGSLASLDEIFQGFNLDNDPIMKSKYYSNMARLMFLDWKENYGITDSKEIYDMFNMSIDLNFDDPFAHCWLGTCFKEIDANSIMAEKEYRLAFILSSDAKHEFDKNHPIFSHNLALFIMDEVILGNKPKSDLVEAEELFIFSIKMNEQKKLKFTWAQKSLNKCRTLMGNL
ncbi:hypothetical protein JN11_03924 [Mucilaginibacter frigoritolerans]|uniref:Novel STAND NTPase 5 domain-containing protein n=1 Tax=Mucilaginibacter frigoritolerans TaxID=652788 RepID=A0A562TT86_9SPHI|nr:hypothetical protein [Mucilaginibacter frigoritolerans]TWI96811.1 hypothetical protein JN11_03924 [Mucilaginibacter frigoritolerans]